MVIHQEINTAKSRVSSRATTLQMYGKYKAMNTADLQVHVYQKIYDTKQNLLAHIGEKINKYDMSVLSTTETLIMIHPYKLQTEPDILTYSPHQTTFLIDNSKLHSHWK